jgi:hypothetical protein
MGAKRTSRPDASRGLLAETRHLVILANNADIADSNAWITL